MEQYHWSRMRYGNKCKKRSWFSSFIVLKPRDVGLSFNLTLETVRKYGRHCPSTSHKWPWSPCTAVHCTISERKKMRMTLSRNAKERSCSRYPHASFFHFHLWIKAFSDPLLNFSVTSPFPPILLLSLCFLIALIITSHTFYFCILFSLPSSI